MVSNLYFTPNHSVFFLSGLWKPILFLLKCTISDPKRTVQLEKVPFLIVVLLKHRYQADQQAPQSFALRYAYGRVNRENKTIKKRKKKKEGGKIWLLSF